ncbi:unnamed protein product [Citrullus colocynthis]|uniref:Uncharacterized protein n=1 Tax=Citrullus colocynthis TaxID=252529 RepID=A0ABP0YH61_9ROSI
MTTMTTKAINENTKLDHLKPRDHFFNMLSLFFLFTIAAASIPTGTVLDFVSKSEAGGGDDVIDLGALLSCGFEMFTTEMARYNDMSKLYNVVYKQVKGNDNLVFLAVQM